MPIYEKIDTTTNSEGEVAVKNHTIIRRVTTEDFIRVYISDLAGLLQVDTLGEYKVLILLWKMSQLSYEQGLGNKIVLVKAVKEELAEQIGFTYASINNIIASLARKNLLLSEKRTIYYLNPNFFFKGYEKDRIEAVKRVELLIEYQIEDNIRESMTEAEEERKASLLLKDNSLTDTPDTNLAKAS